MSNDNSEIEYANTNESDLIYDLVNFFKTNSRTFFFATFISIVFTVSLYLFTPSVFTSSAVLKMQDNLKDQNANSLSSSSSALAFRFLGQTADKTSFAVQKLKSTELLEYTLNKYDYYDEVFAASGIDATGKIMYNNKYDGITKTWKEGIPNIYDVNRLFQKKFNVKLDAQTGFIEMSYSHVSKYFAVEMIDKMVNALNEITRDEDSAKADESIKYLLAELKDAKNITYVDSLSRIIEEQANKKMLSEVNKNYLVDYIDKPYVPTKKSGPSLFLNLILNFIFFQIGAIFYVGLKLKKYINILLKKNRDIRFDR